MAIFKCKICGGALEIDSAQSVATCEYCGTKQTLPRLDDERRTNLYDRANHFRRNNDFDKAMGIFEQILNEEPTDAEAYWSIVLCRYGIEYVEDPTTRRRVPTVNRAQFTSIFDDEDYKSAIANADGYQREIYEAEANAINELQKNILAISQKEEPFDVFICYKETDVNGRRTQDSVLATELYHELTKEGFKVFFSRITLEDKLGIAYEPYIFAALNSAKVMVVLGTRPEHFNAVWVKNEWSRYLALIKNGARKALIPAYRGMDPYDLPEEFSHLQAQDMSKLGFMQDLTRGIKKIVEADAPKGTRKETIATTTLNIAPLLKRIFMFLEDGDFENADEYCEKVLDQDPENAQAYLGKLMVEMRAKHQEDLANCSTPLNESRNYQKALLFADTDLATSLKEIKGKNAQKIESDRKEDLYLKAIDNYKSTDVIQLQEAVEIFTSLAGYKNSDEYIRMCEKRIEQIHALEEKFRIEQERLAEEKRIAEEKAQIERQRQLEIARIKIQKKRAKYKKISKITLSAIAIITTVSLLIAFVFIPSSKYNKAIEYMENGKLEDAYYTFEALDGFKDSDKKLLEIRKQQREQAFSSGVYTHLRNAKLGEVVKLGSFEQDGNTNTQNEQIEWIVLDKANGKLLLISKYLLYSHTYEAVKGDTCNVNWENSDLRMWLNEDFLKNAFSFSQRSLIEKTENSGCQDYIYILNADEIRNYFPNESERATTPTSYASKIGNHWDGVSSWWLRSSGGYSTNPSCVYPNGTIKYSGWNHSAKVGVRPAMWVVTE